MARSEKEGVLKLEKGKSNNSRQRGWEVSTNETLEACKATIYLIICNFSNRRLQCYFMDFQECIPNAVESF